MTFFSGFRRAFAPIHPAASPAMIEAASRAISQILSARQRADAAAALAEAERAARQQEYASTLARPDARHETSTTSEAIGLEGASRALAGTLPPRLYEPNPMLLQSRHEASHSGSTRWQDHGDFQGRSAPDAGAIEAHVHSPPPEDRGGPTGPAPAHDHGRHTPPGHLIRFLDEIPEAPPNPLTLDQQRSWDRFNQVNPRATALQMSEFFQSIGIDPAQVNIADLANASQAGLAPEPAADARFGVPDITDMRGEGGFLEGLDAFGRGIADVSSLGFADEIAAGANALVGNGTYDENLGRERAIDLYDTQNHFWPRTGGQLVGVLRLPTGARRAFANGIRAGTSRLAGEGALYGGAYGVGSADGDLDDRARGGAFGAVAGAGLGYGAGRLLGPVLGPGQAAANASGRIVASTSTRAGNPRPNGNRRGRGPAPKAGRSRSPNASSSPPPAPHVIARYLRQGQTLAQAKYLAETYPRQGHHFFPQRWKFPSFFAESRFNLLKPRNISRGDFYELHFNVDPHFHGTGFPRRVGGSWSGHRAGLKKHGQAGRLWHGSPRPLKIAVGTPAAAAGGGGYLYSQTDD